MNSVLPRVYSTRSCDEAEASLTFSLSGRPLLRSTSALLTHQRNDTDCEKGSTNHQEGALMGSPDREKSKAQYDDRNARFALHSITPVSMSQPLAWASLPSVLVSFRSHLPEKRMAARAGRLRKETVEQTPGDLWGLYHRFASVNCSFNRKATSRDLPAPGPRFWVCYMFAEAL